MTSQGAPVAVTIEASRDGVLARTALILIACWPTVMGYVVLWQGRSNAFLELLSVLSVAVLLLAAGISANRGAGLGVMERWQVALVVALAAAFAVSTSLSARDPLLALVHGVFDATLAAGAVGAFLLLRAGGEVMLRRMLLSVVLSGLLYVVFYATHFEAMVALADGDATLSFFPFVNVRRLTNVLAPTAVIALVMWAAHGSRDRRLFFLYGISATLLVTFLIWSGGRAPVGASLLVLVGLSLWARGDFQRRLISGSAIAYVTGAIASVFLPRTDSGSLFLLGRLWCGDEQSFLDSCTSFRTWLWSETLRLIPDQLWFGHGYRQWIMHKAEFALHGSAHNFPLQVVFDFGLFGGGAAVLLAYATWVRHLRRLDGRNTLHVVAVAGLSVMMVQCLADAIFTIRPSLQLVLLFFAMSSAALQVGSNHSLRR